MKTVIVFKRQDDGGHWYWIPSDDVDRFEKMLSEIEGKMYMECPEKFDNFSNSFEDYRTLGSPEIAPEYFHRNGYVTEIGVEPKEWPSIESIINK